MSRDDISRAFDDARKNVEMPEIDLSKVEVPKIDLPKIDVSKIDIPKAVAAAGLIGRTTRRPRLPFIIGGLVTLGLVGYALMTSPAVRPKLQEAGRRIRERIDERRAMMRDDADLEAVAFDAAVAVPIEPSAFQGSAPKDGSPFDGSSSLPDGLGADVSRDETTAYEPSLEAHSEV
jgi:hypothetical protein